MAKARFRGLADHVAAVRPDIDDVAAAVSDGRLLVDGKIVDNVNMRVRADAAVTLRAPQQLRGEAKLRAALDAFDVSALGRVALDAGAAAGGFTKVLLAAGASKVYAVDTGHGQLLGSLRQDGRVVNLEATNLGDLSTALVPDVVAVVTLDLSYLSISDAVPQLEAIKFDVDADLVTLVKPMFELGLDQPPTDPARLQGAVARASAGIEQCAWEVVDRIGSPVRGTNGAVEFFLHARRR
jgi:23S rRNA (cytidine1920-2'-O)/16S rRNA (cytidine1409-2'-O)-methyltransferase